MGTLTEKINYLKQTKQYIKEAIISKGQSVSSSDTFRSYASKIENITTESDLESKIIRQNGHYYPTGGYDGFSDVDVGIGQIGETYEAINKSGNNITTNDKVWLNYKPVEVESQTEVTGFTSNYNKALLNSVTDDSIYFAKATNNAYSISGRSFYTSDNELINNTNITTIVYDPISKTEKYSCRQGRGYVQEISSNDISAISNKAYYCDGHISVYEDGTNGYIQVNGVTVLSRYNGHFLNTTFGWKDSSDNNYYVFIREGDTQYLYRVDIENNSLIRISSVSFTIDWNDFVHYGMTQDLKYFVYAYNGISVHRVDIAQSSVTRKTDTGDLSNFFVNHTMSNYSPYYNGLKDIILLAPKSGSLKNSAIFKYNPTTELWDKIDITFPDITPSGYLIGSNDSNLMAQITEDLTTLICKSEDGSGNIIICTLANDGGWVITNYNNINQDSLTGYAAENISTNTTGDVVIGTILQPTLENKIVRQNGLYYPTTGYDGIGSVEVMVGQIGRTYEAINKTGNTLEENDKVWLNYREPTTDSVTTIAYDAYTDNSFYGPGCFIIPSGNFIYYINGFRSLCAYDVSLNTNTNNIHTSLDRFNVYFDDNGKAVLNYNSGTDFINGTSVNSTSWIEKYHNIRVNGSNLEKLINGTWISYTGSISFYNNECLSALVNDEPVIYGIYNSNSRYYITRVLLNDVDNTCSTTNLVDLGTRQVLAQVIGSTNDGKYVIFGTSTPYGSSWGSSFTDVFVYKVNQQTGDLTAFSPNTPKYNLLNSNKIATFNNYTNVLSYVDDNGNYALIKYNPENDNWEDFEVAGYNASNIKTPMCLSADGSLGVARFQYSHSQNYKVQKYTIATSGGWDIISYNYSTFNSITGYAAETITPNTVGDVIVGIQGGGSDEDAYDAKLTLQGVVDGLPQPTEEEIIEDTLEILTNI